ncbi:ABC transporter substrate-binding protein [candidate division KSB1 bacterium]
MFLTSNIKFNSNKRLVTNLSAFLFIFFIISIQNSHGFQQPSEYSLNWGELSIKIKTLNPYESSTIEEKNILNLIFGEPLYKSDPITNAITRGIVESGVQSSETWLYNIRSDIRFQDGTPLTSEDVKFSIETFNRFIENSGRFFNNEIAKIDSISILNRQWFQVYVSREVGDHELMLKDLPILSRDYYQGGDFQSTLNNISNKPPMGYGPYQVSSFIPESGITLIRNEYYYLGRPEFSTVNIVFYEEQDRMTSDFITGDLHFIQVYDLRSRQEISRADTSLKILPVQLSEIPIYFINYNITHPLLRSDRIRKSINQLYSKVNYTKSDIQGFHVRSIAAGPVPPRSVAFLQDLDKNNYDPNRARSYFRRQGWNDRNGDGILEKNNVNFSLELILSDNDAYLEELVRNIQRDLGEIGIEVTPVLITPEELRNRIRRNDFVLALDKSIYYPHDLVRTFHNFFDISGNTINRNRLGQNNTDALQNLGRAGQFLLQDDAAEIFQRLQYLHSESATSEYLTYQHHIYYAINSKIISEFAPYNILVSPGLWKPVRDNDNQQ